MDIDYSTGIYRCKDISSFQIKISLKTIRPSLIRFSELHKDVQDAELEELILTWQQRVFSPWEIQFYGNIENCTSELHKTYNKKILEITNGGNYKKNIIFSYTAQDFIAYSEKEVIHTRKYDSFRFLPKQIRHHPSNPCKDVQSIKSFTIVDYEPSSQTMPNNQLLSSVDQEFMCVMVDVGYVIDGKVNEQVLVTLKWEPSLRVLTVFPDFNSTSNPGYTIEGLYDVRSQYLFWFTCLKQENYIKFEKQDEEKSVQCRVPLIINDTILPHLRMLDVYLFGEIKSVENFEQDKLFINFNFELKEGWNFISGDLFGVTYTSRNISGSTCCFNHLFELHFTTSSYKNINLDLVPQLLLEVMSFDEWGRVCREGCGWIQILLIPGQRMYKIPTWRFDARNSRVNSMKRFFIGATSHTANRSVFGIPSTFTGRKLSKFGFRTVSSGSININIFVVLQSQDLCRLPSKMNYEERLSTSSLLKSVNSAFNAFSLARQKLNKVYEIVS